MIELQKWLRTATRSIHKDNLKRKKTLNNIASTTIVSRYIHKIIPDTDIQTIAKRKPDSIISLINYIKDNRQQHVFQENYEYRETHNKSSNIQVKVTQHTSQPKYILSKQQTNTIIHKSPVSNKIQQRIQFKNLNELKQILHQSEGNSINNFDNRVISTTINYDRVTLNTIYYYPTNNNTNDRFLLTTRQYILIVAVRKINNIAGTPIYRLYNNNSNSYQIIFKTK